MAIYQFSTNNFLGIDRSSNYLYIVRVKVPEFIEINDKQATVLAYENQRFSLLEPLDVKYHDGKFTRFKLDTELPRISSSFHRHFSLNLLFHEEFMQIERYALQGTQQLYFETTPQKSNISLDELESHFDDLEMINRFSGSQLERVGVRNKK